MLVLSLNLFAQRDSIRNRLPRVDTVRMSIQYISDIDFAKEEYQIEFWLRLSSDSSDSETLKKIEKQIAVENAKSISVDTIPNWNSKNYNPYRKELKIKCTMIQKWDLDSYPFDRQELNIKIYNAARPTKWFAFQMHNDQVNYTPAGADHEEIEKGWTFISNSAKATQDSIVDPFLEKYSARDTTKFGGQLRRYSAINYHIVIFRKESWFLFAKLLLGMYVAFFVAFAALFLDIQGGHSRLELPVGGLFAAIANKYIIESILPQSPQFTLVDKLHSVSIIFIFLILAYSVWLLLKSKKHERNDKERTRVEKINRYFPLVFFIVYVVLNVAFILGGVFESRL